jgi:hypothetical protein
VHILAIGSDREVVDMDDCHKGASIIFLDKHARVVIATTITLGNEQRADVLIKKLGRVAKPV